MRCLTSGMGRKAVVGIAAALIVCPIVTLVGYKRWIDTRTFNPLDIPVSLSQGHFKTPEFYVNLKGQYAAKISVGYAASDRPECQEEALEPLRAHFIAYQNGVPVGETDQPGYAGSGSLDLEIRGYYSLDVKILSDASCLDSAHPRLQVWTWGWYYTDRFDTALWAIPTVAIAGLAVLGFVATVLARKAKPCRIAETEKEEVPTGLPVYRHRTVKLMAGFPHFPLLCATLLALLVFILAILQTPFRSKGLYVSVGVNPSDVGNLNSPMPPVVVRIRLPRPGAAPKLSVDSTSVDWDGLGDALKVQLKLRAQWVVYVDGDCNLPWQDVAQVADIAKGVNAKVVLLTPETRKLVEPEMARKKSARR